MKNDLRSIELKSIKSTFEPRPSAIAEALPSASTIHAASDADRHTIVVLCVLAMGLLAAGSLIYPSAHSASPSLHSASSASFNRLINSVDQVRAPAPPSAARQAHCIAEEAGSDSSHSFEPLGLVAAVFFLVLAMLDWINDSQTRPIDHSSRATLPNSLVIRASPCRRIPG